MDRSYRILPTYTGDVSGAASALYELGGMVVIHDPSGCNSTYNTHDEIRWYDQESLIFISGLAERDAVLGNDNKLISDVLSAAFYYKPAFIALLSSPIPYINGTDFAALARIIEKKTGIPTFFVPTNGMHDYVHGAGNALLMIAKHFIKAPEDENENPARCAASRASDKAIGQREDTSRGMDDKAAGRKLKVNLLGATPLDFAAEGAVDHIKTLLQNYGFDVHTCWAMGSTLDDLRKSAEADVNLVISVTGLKTARHMEHHFAIPFVTGLPVGRFTEPLMKALKEAAGSRTSAWPCRDLRLRPEKVTPFLSHSPEVTLPLLQKPTPPAPSPAFFIGEPVAAGSYALALEMESGIKGRVVTSLEDSTDLLGPDDLSVTGEAALEKALKEAALAVGDAFYEAVCPPTCVFIPLPHLAFSGRNALKDLRSMDPYDIKHLLKGIHYGNERHAIR